jgi:ABC-type sugar transport system ATPase subunit
MKATMKELVQATQPINRIIAMDMPAKVAFRVAADVKEIERKLDTYHEVRKKTVDRFLKDEEVEKIEKLSKDGRESLTAEIKELQAEEVELDITPWPSSLFDDLKLRPQDIILLLPFIEG